MTYRRSMIYRFILILFIAGLTSFFCGCPRKQHSKESQHACNLQCLSFSIKSPDLIDSVSILSELSSTTLLCKKPVHSSVLVGDRTN